MRIKLLVENPRLQEVSGILLLLLSIGLFLSLVSYSPSDPSSNVAVDATGASNWMGLPGSFAADLVLQTLGLAGFLVPVWLISLGWNRIRRSRSEQAWRRIGGGTLLTTVLCCLLESLTQLLQIVLPDAWHQTVRPGGAWGKVVSEPSIALLNVGGTVLLMVALTAVGLYLLTSLQLGGLFGWSAEPATDAGNASGTAEAEEPLISTTTVDSEPYSLQPSTPIPEPGPSPGDPVWSPPEPKTATESQEGVPPIVPYPNGGDSVRGGAELGGFGEEFSNGGAVRASKPVRSAKPRYELPPVSLLNPPFGRESYDEAQLQETARQIVEKFDEFEVRGSVNQINPGPVVTTFEFKPDRGVKYSKIVNLSEDLCLALECESILVERIPGRPTVGIEVPNKNREIIALTEVIDSPGFRQSVSMLNFALGKDINGKIHCADLSGMPHLLVAGQTGSGKSVMVNSLIMSILLRATPEQVRFILIDPKTVELGLYRDIPHLLTPVITDMKKANNALRNATREMERRLQLLAQHGVRNIGQFNDSVELEKRPSGAGSKQESVEKLPYIVVIVDELADLMMSAGRQIEESITRLAQMARAVGIHLLLATQRPSVDVITGLIKANIPARLSFLLATRVDSRTILDSMGAESLLGRGDMLFLPPGTARMRRLHGPLVSEDEIQAVVEHWREQASPAYENEYLESPDGESDETEDDDAGFDDPMYRDAVRLVLEMGKASTSTLQRRLRLGYGRAARILDVMERDGIIGPPDGSRPREVLKRPDWLDETERE